MIDLKRILLSLSASFLLAFSVVTPVAAQVVKPLDTACSGRGSSSPACAATTDPISGSGSVILKAANIVAIIAGIAGVILIMVGGFKYVTSQGESGSVQSAKNTILYAVIGLVIVVMARVIVGFAVTKLL